MDSQSSMASTSKKRTFRSDVWEHYQIVESNDDGKDKASCNYCKQVFACHPVKNGTSTMTRHLLRCKRYVTESDKTQQLLPFPKLCQHGPTTTTCTFTQEITRQTLARMIIKEELPMRMVEWDGFKEFVDSFQRDFIIPSRRTVRRDIEQIYKKEKLQLGNYIRKSGQRICLTTDTWTSEQNVNYMVLTGHFLDSNWKLHKKILNFCKIEGHRGEIISKQLENCLHEWGTEKVFSITVDNASSNKVAIEQLVRILRHGKGLVLDGDYIHVRCFAHILNLIVVEGLKEHQASIDRVRKAVKYVKSSPQRLQVFKNCIDSLKIKFKGNVTLDVPTRWNATYLMLDNAEKYSTAFELLADSNINFRLDIEASNDVIGIGPPTLDDWNEIRELCKYLKVFYDTTVKVSASSHITSHKYVIEACEIKVNIQKLVDSENTVFKNMALGMMIKFEKYWGDFEKFNILFFVAILFDPRCKSKIVKYCLGILFGDDKVHDLYKRVEDVLEKLYMDYKGDDGPECTIIGHEETGDDLVSKYFGRVLDSVDVTSECQDYLNDKLIQHSKNLDILAWWKVQESTYPVLSQIARDVLIIPISTVPAESAFSCGGRIISSSRTSLLPSTVEAIICTQSWIRSTTPTLNEAATIVEDYPTIDEELAAFNRENASASSIDIFEEEDEMIIG